jgi:uncharacterized protein (DUF486 family)
MFATIFRGSTNIVSLVVVLTIFLLLISNTFMTYAWYGHLKHRDMPMIAAILVSWSVALGEYCFQVPANRIGYGRFTGYQLKIIQEAITLVVFARSPIFTWASRSVGITWRRSLAWPRP